MTQHPARRFLLSVLSIAALGLAPVYAQAGVTIAPVVINIDPARALSGQTSFTNGSDKSIEFSVTVQAWSQQGNQNVLADTRDVLVNPASFQLSPGSTQVIRVGLRKKPGAAELTYRLLIAQKNGGSTVDNAQGIALQVLPTFSLPIYISAGEAKPVIAYTAARDGQDLLLRLVNSGSKHQTYNNLVVSSGALSLAVPSQAVLAGSTFTVRLPGFAAATSPLKLSYLDYTQVQRSDTVPLP